MFYTFTFTLLCKNKKKILIILFLISILLSTAKKHKKKKPKSSESSSEHDDSDSKESGSREFGRQRKHGTVLKLKGTLRQRYAFEAAFQDPTHNSVCSPVAALLPLGKLALGAEDDSRDELFKMIGVSDSHQLSSSLNKLITNLQYLPGVKLTIASRLYVSDQAEMKTKFVKKASKIFGSDAQKISFENSKSVADEINGWVSRETSGKVPLLLSPNQISSDSSLVIVNAIYVNGAWKEPFKTMRVGDFYSPTGQKKVQFMSHSSKYNYVKSDFLNAQIVEVMFQGLTTSLIVVLPQNKYGLPLLVNQLKLAPNLLNDDLRKAKSQKVTLTIPKFQISTTLDMKDLYEKIGIKIATSQKSGLKNIVNGTELVISNAIQKAVIEVHEIGTEAGAGLGSFVGGSASAEEPIVFLADRPFLFFLQANEEQLFSGIYSEP